MTGRKSIWQWSCDWVGDPSSWQRRGEIILAFLQENGLTAQSQVLDIGCGNLSEGAPLIRLLAPGHFAGLEPAGWLVEAALQEFPELESQAPVFLFGSDFDASELGRRFTHVVSHSVLSHAAHWQLDQFLANTRKVVDEGAVMLASYIEDQYNGFAEQWVYPGVSTFRLRTLMSAGWQFGWKVEPMPEYRERLVAECPNDTHQWVRCVAVPSTAEMNELRLREEELQREEREALREREMARVAAAGEADAERIRAAGVLP